MTSEVRERREIRHVYQTRGFGAAGPTFTALPSEMRAFEALPWWRRLGGARRHFRRLERERQAG